MYRLIHLILGFTFLLIGAIGVILPLLPTTPFIILAAYCFSKSSKKFHLYLLNHRLFGGMLRDWEAYGIIPFKVKCLSTVMMLVMISYPMFFLDLAWWVKLLVLLTIVIALAYIWSRPSRIEGKAGAVALKQDS
ncbi:YbaN family protein [Thalassomonas viridans]|uniref:Inner membrane protein n=1 Tax=Thalassomonas viridans TaxID=137584 RepID=A0AAE9Z2Z1_9GAMM|nr:YbaN family protein [Thalassomonas viridans]WDE04247.1 YbaN family protein [Thalassomonas viridans]